MENQQGTEPRFSGEILLCEDNEINQHFIKSHLNRVGFDVVIAVNGRDCCDIIAKRAESGKPFDLVFMDIHMPVMDGLEAASFIMEAGIETPVVALTSNVSQKDNEIYAAHGMKTSLLKPFTPEQLLDCLCLYFTPISREQYDLEKRKAEEQEQRDRLFSGFVRRNQNTYQEICAALEAGDIKTAHRLAHTLRGLAGLMRKQELREAAGSVENALAGGEAAALEAGALEALGRELDAVLCELSPYLEDLEQREQPETWEPGAAKELFNRLEALIRADSAECRKLTGELRAIPETNELISLLEDYEFEDAGAALARLRTKLNI